MTMIILMFVTMVIIMLVLAGDSEMMLRMVAVLFGMAMRMSVLVLGGGTMGVITFMLN